MCDVTWAGTSSSVLFKPRHVRTIRERLVGSGTIRGNDMAYFSLGLVGL